MPESEHLTFVLHGENGIVPVDALVAAVKRIATLVLDVQRLETRGAKPRPWVVESLASSAPTITIAPSTPTGTGTVPIVIEGLRALTVAGDSTLPAAFGEKPLEDARSLGLLLKRRGGITNIDVTANGASAGVAPLSLDERIHERVQTVLAAGYSDFGSIEGSLDAVTLHGRSSVTLWDDMTGVPVRCPIPKSPFWIEKVRNALGKRVVVNGRVHYFGNGLPRWVEMETLSELAGAGEGRDFGSIPDLTGTEDSVAYVRRMRD